MSAPVDECERIALTPPEATAERQAAWRRWVDDYAITTSLLWIERDGTNEDAALHGMQILLADWAQLDKREWMPLGRAQVVTGTAAIFDEQKEGEDRLDYMNAVRTVETATWHERTCAMAYHMGFSLQQAQEIAGDIARQQGFAPEGDGSTALYRYFDADGVLLYIGITNNVDLRDKQHSANSDWHHLSTDRDVEWHDTRAEASKAERQYIREEGPLFNTTYASKETKRRAMAYLIERVKRAEQVAS